MPLVSDLCECCQEAVGPHVPAQSTTVALGSLLFQTRCTCGVAFEGLTALHAEVQLHGHLMKVMGCPSDRHKGTATSRAIAPVVRNV